MEQFIYKEKNLLSEEGGRKKVLIDGEEHFHLSRVLRVRQGEKILATDGAGKTLLCVVSTIGKEHSVCEVAEEYADLNSARRRFCVAISFLKPVSKLETAIEKCTELGARAFLLFSSERSEGACPRPDRLTGIIRSAVKQSQRSRIPDLAFAESLEEAAVNRRSYDERIVLHEKSGNAIGSRILNINTDRSVIALIGPEGGFSENEIELLGKYGYVDMSLGNARLRSETAAITIASLLSVY